MSRGLSDHQSLKLTANVQIRIVETGEPLELTEPVPLAVTGIQGEETENSGPEMSPKSDSSPGSDVSLGHRLPSNQASRRDFSEFRSQMNICFRKDEVSGKYQNN